MKYNPFFSPEFQETMKRISNIHLECVRNVLPNAMTSQIQQIQESLTAPCRELIQSYSSIMSSSLASQISQFNLKESVVGVTPNISAICNWVILDLAISASKLGNIPSPPSLCYEFS